MKNKTLIVIVILLILLMLSVYVVYIYRNYSSREEQEITSEYAQYYNQQKTGTELISIINRTADINENNNIEKDENGFYIENETNSIKIYIEFIYEDGTRTLEMERIINNDIKSFIKAYSTANFKCTNIEYHNKTKNVKSLTFVQTED